MLLTTLAWPLLTLLVPRERSGVVAGLMTGASSVAAVFAGIVAAAMGAAWGYRGGGGVLNVVRVTPNTTAAAPRAEG